ncbi:hypothetical protein LEP1GSC016_2723 [Leptospira borgpetersenii serovar Hardjo-bovis str. Sponselee]|uniref:Uncharacterized protein n=3 Tax=Leptospira borgpetersenii TaxID=174 RepID=M3GUR2_LEPBO|nr:hypothetical protein LEP1GSC123_1875 [Leptospira borgpetersenii str. 200701203]EMJ82026.1 hypothetical protein LEP1GSC016_2723 [Leptospira borgpetersenii serovar Hardjo-bovis str. Sponselee]EMN13239.1 hypothetical protein LEP1GSC055_0536 [Leptospira borgpetersenii str. Brem 307]EMN16980.1 hypothetical protein LEP1GSC056_2535 [Leptospira borgpetersenii str. Brem 328]
MLDSWKRLTRRKVKRFKYEKNLEICFSFLNRMKNKNPF